jgi:O-antigen/teichoic acid export membrane protein
MPGGTSTNITIPIVLSILHRFSSTLFGFLNFFILARVLPKNELGIWSIFLFVVAAFEMSKGSLLKNAHIRLILTSKNRNLGIIAGSSISVNVIFTILFITLILLFSPNLSNWLNAGKQLSTMLMLYIPGLISMIYFSHYEAVQQSNHNFKNGFTANLIRQLLFFILLLVHFIRGNNLDLFTLVYYYTLGNFIGTFIFFILSRKYISYTFQYSLKTIKEILNFGGFMMGGNIITQISSNLDQLLVSRYLSTEYVGNYGIASRVMYAVEIPMNGVSEALFPTFTKASGEGDKQRFNNYLEKSIGTLIAIMLPAIIIMVCLTEFIIKIIAGNNYNDANEILQIYLIITLINIFKHQSSNTLLSLGKSKLHFIITIINFVFYIGMIYLGIKEFEYLGPAYAKFLLSVISLFMWVVLMKKLIGINISNIIKHLIGFYPNLFKLFIKPSKRI